MADSKLEIKVGPIAFSGEGSGDWLAKQLDKVLDKVPKLLAVADGATGTTTAASDASAGTAARSGAKAAGTLAAFLKEKKATSNQVRKFLAAAVWLHDSQNKSRLSTTEVSSALNTHNQGRLGNAAQCLIRNAEKGWVVKDGKKNFYVSDEGRAELAK